MPVVKLAAGDYPILKLLTELKAVASRSEGERLIKQGAVEWDKTIVKDFNFTVQIRKANPEDMWTLRVGKKKFLRVAAE